MRNCPLWSITRAPPPLKVYPSILSASGADPGTPVYEVTITLEGIETFCVEERYTGTSAYETLYDAYTASLDGGTVMVRGADGETTDVAEHATVGPRVTLA